MVDAHRDPAGVRGQVVDPVRGRLAQLRIGDVMRGHLDRLTHAAPLPTGGVVLADQFAFFLVSTLTTGSPAAW